MSIQRSFILSLLLCCIQSLVHGQDTLLLLNGKELYADSISFNGHAIHLTDSSAKGIHKLLARVSHTFSHSDSLPYHPSRKRAINPYRAFSIRDGGGGEKVVFQPDPADPMDFSIEQMRLFIKGEQDADKYYHNNVNKAAAFAVGVGASYFTIWGLVIPPLYATAIGSFTPKMSSKYASESPFVDDPVYSEGYQRKMRDRKIRNALVSGLVGFAAGFVTLSIIN